MGGGPELFPGKLHTPAIFRQVAGIQCLRYLPTEGGDPPQPILGDVLLRWAGYDWKNILLLAGFYECLQPFHRGKLIRAGEIGPDIFRQRTSDPGLRHGTN